MQPDSAAPTAQLLGIVYGDLSQLYKKLRKVRQQVQANRERESSLAAMAHHTSRFAARSAQIHAKELQQMLVLKRQEKLLSLAIKLLKQQKRK